MIRMLDSQQTRIIRHAQKINRYTHLIILLSGDKFMESEIKAKVFISCGQQKDTDEVKIALEIREKLEKLGYEPYIAVEEKTLKGVKENILNQLANSEYLVFIDFKREQLVTKPEETIHRGSLFSNQELAVASFLDIPFVAFQEEGVKKDDGILKFVQANCTPFKDMIALLDLVTKCIEQQEWKPNWKNELVLERDEKEFVDTNVQINANGQIIVKPSRFFHVEVENLHQRKIASNCYAYFKSFRDLSTGKETVLETVESKWKGYVLPNATILPTSSRYFDAFYVLHDAPNQLRFNLFADYSGYYPRISGPGDFEMTYVVVSDAFQPATARLELHLGERLEDISLRKVSTTSL